MGWEWNEETIGYYETPEKRRIYATSKPSAWHRWWNRVLLGWEWWEDFPVPPVKADDENDEN